MDKLRNRDFITMKIFKPQKDNIYRNRVIASVISAIILLCIISAIVFYVINEYEVRLDDTFNCIVCSVVCLCTYIIVYALIFKFFIWDAYEDYYMGELKKAYNACNTYFFCKSPRKELVEKKDYIELITKSCKDFPSFLNIPSYKHIKGLDNYIKDQGDKFRHTDFLKEYVKRFPYAMTYLSIKKRIKWYNPNRRIPFYDIITFVYGKIDINSFCFSTKAVEDNLDAIENDYKKKLGKLESMRSVYPFGVDLYILKHKATGDYVSFVKDLNFIIFDKNYISAVIEYEKNKEIFIKDLLAKDSENVEKVKKQRREQKELEAKQKKEQEELEAKRKKRREELEAKREKEREEQERKEEEHRKWLSNNVMSVVNNFNSVAHKPALLYLTPDDYKYSRADIEGLSKADYERCKSIVDGNTSEYDKFRSRFKESISDVPFVYLWNYVPKEVRIVDKEDAEKSRLILSFKDGGNVERVSNEIITKLNDLFRDIVITKKDGSKHTIQLSDYYLVCIPPSTQARYERRFQAFSSEVSKKCGINSDFKNIVVESGVTPGHLGGDIRPRLNIDTKWFKGKKIVLFDDIVTRGNTMRYYIDVLRGLGADIVCCMSLGKTKH